MHIRLTVDRSATGRRCPTVWIRSPTSCALVAGAANCTVDVVLSDRGNPFTSTTDPVIPMSRAGSATMGTPARRSKSDAGVPSRSRRPPVMRGCGWCEHGDVTDLRDYDRWHDRYDDPNSDLSWRLRRVQQYILQFLDQRRGPVRILSVCAGDGRDLFQVLAERGDTGRITATLLELHPGLAERAISTAASTAPDAAVSVRVVDAGNSDAYLGAAPADLVLLVGILGNISDRDVQALIAAAAQFCSPGADVVWSRGRDASDRNDDVRAWFAAAGFAEVEYAALDAGSRPALGLMRYTGEPVDLVPGQHLFTFWR